MLEVIYLIFNEGYAATAGRSWLRPALCEEALRLGRILAELTPDEPEVHGLVALMEIQSSRSQARGGRRRADPAHGAEPSAVGSIRDRRGLEALERARALGGSFGAYVLQASIAACHAQAARRKPPIGYASWRCTTRYRRSRPRRS